MRWPWRRRVERRAAYDDAVIAALQGAAGGGLAKAREAAILEACAAAYARCLSCAEPSAYQTLITPCWLAQVARCLVLDGEAVYQVSVDGEGRLRLYPCASWDVRGRSLDPGGWWYRVDQFAPDGGVNRLLPASEVVHVRYSSDPATPWVGRSPLQRATESARLVGALEEAAADEAASSRGYVIPFSPEAVGDADDDNDTDETAQLRADLRALRGKAAFVESARQDGMTGSKGDWEARRLGYDPPSALVAMRRQVEESIAMAAGVPVGMLFAGDATSAREAYRQFMFSSLSSMALQVEDELRMKIGEISLSLDRLYASDTQARGRAFKSLVDGGLTKEQALQLTGFDG